MPLGAFNLSIDIQTFPQFLAQSFNPLETPLIFPVNILSVHSWMLLGMHCTRPLSPAADKKWSILLEKHASQMEDDSQKGQ